VLIEQSIEAKIELAKNTRMGGITDGALLAVLIVAILLIIKNLLDRFFPPVKTKTTTH
jgi:xanthine/uracil permease